MKICLILEGSYPYVHGGVSSWTHDYIKGRPNDTFILWTIMPDRTTQGHFVYELPENVAAVHECFLADARTHARHRAPGHRHVQLTPVQREAASAFFACKRPDWETLFDLVDAAAFKPEQFLFSETFLDIVTELLKRDAPWAPYAETFHTLRSMFLPLLYIMDQPVPEADLYHAISTGYAGVLGVKARHIKRRPLVLTEHGIYSREREEELIRASWIKPMFKRGWIQFFYMLSDAIYSRADAVSSLYGGARAIQIELGAPAARSVVISNGIDYPRMAAVPPKVPNGTIDIGAFVRFAKIKDIKTMITAFGLLAEKVDHVRLHICGGVDDADYRDECLALIAELGIQDKVLVPGLVDTPAYMAGIDFTLLTSISEGQPLCVMESFAAGRPAVTTDVGCCRELISGREGDTFGEAGIVAAPMHVEDLAAAMARLSEDAGLRRQMGQAAKRRADKYFHHETMMQLYADLYEMAERHFNDNKE